MAKIVILDDDYGAEILAENLRSVGHEVRRVSFAEEALKDAEEIARHDLLILDIIMPPVAPGTSASGGRQTGMTVYQAVRKANRKLPVLAFTASNDPDVIEILKADEHASFVSKWSTPRIKDLLDAIDRLLGTKTKRQIPRPFIVHGHDEATKLAVKNYLQNVLKLPEPIILHEQPNAGRTLIEKFEHYSSQAQLAFVLLTPDDRIAAATATNEEKRRARQNVIFEMGYFLATLGRASGRVLLLYRGPLELPSDIQGVIYIDIGAGIESAGEQIRRELSDVL